MEQIHVSGLGEGLRGHFPIYKNYKKMKQGFEHSLCYLDSAATAHKPQIVIDALKHHMEFDYGPVHRGAYDLSARSSHLYESARANVASFLGPNCKTSNVIFTRGTTEALNMIASGLSRSVLDDKSRIVTTLLEHHSNFVPWQQAALKANCEIAYIEPVGTSGTDLRLNLTKAQKLISKNTKVLAFAYMGNVIGQVNPIKELISYAQSVGAFVILDCAQSITCLDDDLFALGADAVCFSGHKIYGPTGIGVCALSDRLINILPPFMFGGGMVSGVTAESAQWTTAPAKFEAGTPPMTEAIGLSAALDWVRYVGGQKALHAHCSKLTQKFIEGLKACNEIELFAPQTGQETMVSFRHKKVHAHDVSTILDSYGIAVRSGHHCAWPLVQFLGVDALIRVSFGPYNDEDDVEKAVYCLKNNIKL